MVARTVRVLSTAHDVRDARLGRIVRAVQAAGCDVTLEGIGGSDVGDVVSGVSVVARPPAGAATRVARSLVLPFRGRADVLIVVDPDLIPTAWLAARLLRSRLVVDVHEDYVAVARDRSWATGLVGVVARLLVRAINGLSVRADLLTVADDHVPPLTARRRLVVRNLPPPGSLPPAGDPGPEPRAVYVGDLRESRGLWAMIDAVEEAPGWSLDLVGQVSSGSIDEVRGELSRRGLGDRVTLHGRLASAEAWQVARGAWVGLCLLESTPAYVEAMPSKVLEYLSVGLPVLATPLPRVRSLLDDTGAGVCVSHAQSAATTLRDWSARPDGLSPLRARARGWADQHLAAPDPFGEMAAAILSLSQEHDTA